MWMIKLNKEKNQRQKQKKRKWKYQSLKRIKKIIDLINCNTSSYYSKLICFEERIQIDAFDQLAKIKTSQFEGQKLESNGGLM